MKNLNGLGVVLTLALAVASWSPSERANAQDFDAVVERAASRWADDSVLDASRSALRQFTLEWERALWEVTERRAASPPTTLAGLLTPSAHANFSPGWTGSGQTVLCGSS